MADGENPTQAVKEAKPGSIFDFFGLPRELRDEIYSLLTEDHTIHRGLDEDGYPDGIEIVMTNCVLLNPCLLNHQFKNEYEQEVKDRQKLLVQDTGGQMDYQTLPLMIDRSTPKATVQMLLIHNTKSEDGSCLCAQEFEGHAEGLEHMFKDFEALKDVQIELRPCTSSPMGRTWDVHREELMEHLIPIQNMRFVTKIELFPLFQQNQGVESYCTYKEHQVPVKTWTRAKGWEDN